MTYTDYEEDIMPVPDQITATGATMWIMGLSLYIFYHFNTSSIDLS